MSYGRLNRPISCIFELTMNCFTDCVYCYADRKGFGDKLLSLPQIREILKDLYNSKIVDIVLNGGEVLMHPDIKEILLECTKYGYFPFISTKMPVSGEILKFLKSIGITNIQVSLDSINPETLKNHLNVGGDYLTKIIRTMDLLDQMEFPWRVNTIITKYNSSADKEIIPLIDYLAKYKSLKQITISAAGYSHYKSYENFNSLKVTKENYENSRRKVYEKISCYPHLHIIMKEGNYLLPEVFKQRSICTANQQGFIILPDGKVTICEELYWNPHFIIGDLTKNTIWEIWNSEKAKGLFYLPQSKIQKSSPCSSCEEYENCRSFRGVCWKMIIAAYGKENWDYPDPTCPYAPEIKNNIYM